MRCQTPLSFPNTMAGITYKARMRPGSRRPVPCDANSKGPSHLSPASVFQLTTDGRSPMVGHPMTLLVVREALRVADTQCTETGRRRACAVFGVDHSRAVAYLDVVEKLNRLVLEERLESPPHLLLSPKPRKPCLAPQA